MMQPGVEMMNVQPVEMKEVDRRWKWKWLGRDGSVVMGGGVDNGEWMVERWGGDGAWLERVANGISVEMKRWNGGGMDRAPQPSPLDCLESSP